MAKTFWTYSIKLFFIKFEVRFLNNFKGKLMSGIVLNQVNKKKCTFKPLICTQFFLRSKNWIDVNKVMQFQANHTFFHLLEAQSDLKLIFTNS